MLYPNVSSTYNSPNTHLVVQYLVKHRLFGFNILTELNPTELWYSWSFSQPVTVHQTPTFWTKIYLAPPNYRNPLYKLYYSCTLSVTIAAIGLKYVWSVWISEKPKKNPIELYYLYVLSLFHHRVHIGFRCL